MKASERYALGVGLLAGLLPRAVLAWRLPLTGDEVGTWIYMGKDVHTLLTTFREPWLSMGPFILLCKGIATAFGDHPFVLRLPVLAAGIATIPLLSGTARRMGGDGKTAMVTALLAAFNFYLVYQSTILRSYAFLILGTVGGLYFLLGWLKYRDWRSGWACAGMCGLGWLTHFYMLHTLVVFAAIGLWCLLLPWSRSRFPGRIRSARTLAIPLGILLLPAVLYHARVWPDMMQVRSNWVGPAPSTMDYLPYLSRSFFGEGWWGLPSLILLAAGWVDAVRKAPGRAGLVATGVILPILMYSASGSQHYPWGSTRLLVVILPFLLLQIGFALSELRVKPVLRWGTVALVLISWLPDLRAQWIKGEQYPWREAQAFLARRTDDREWILAPEMERHHLIPGFQSAPWKLVSARDYLTADPNQLEGRQSLLLVTTSSLSAGAEPLRSFGRIHTYRYEGESRQTMASNVVKDVQATLGGRADPGVVSLTYFALTLMEALAWPADEQLSLQRIYYHSLLRSNRGRFMPEAQRTMQFP